VGKVGMGEEWERSHRIHWGSSVMSSPGVMMEVEEESFARLVGWGVSSMEVSPSESRESSSEAEEEEVEWWGGLAGAGGRIVNVIVGGEAGDCAVLLEALMGSRLDVLLQSI